MNTTSAFDLFYKGLSKEDQTLMSQQVDAVLEKSIASVSQNMKTAFDNARREIESEMLANVWGDFIRENSGPCDLIGSMQADIWQAMLKNSPAEIPEYKLRDLVEVWRKRFPDDWSEIVNQDAKNQIESLKSSLEFERKMNRI